MKYTFNEMETRIQSFREAHCGANPEDEVPVRFLFEMAYCLNLDVNIELTDPKTITDATTGEVK